MSRYKENDNRLCWHKKRFRTTTVTLFWIPEMPISLHSHSGEFCKHAFGTLEETVRRAIELGFTHYGLSEHMPRYESDDLYDEEIELGLEPGDLVDMFDDFVKQARHLQEKYSKHICLLVGMETDVIRDDSFDKIRELRERLKLDYLVGSVHHVDGVPTDFSHELFNKAEALAGGTEGVMCKYFDHQYELMRAIKPEVIGHFDVIRLYRPDFEFSESIWKKIVRNLNYGISYGALFEINTSGASPRKSLKVPYPSARILEFLVCSGARLTLSDDGHGPSDVGFWYNNLPGFLSANHITELYCLERSHPGDYKTLGCSNQVVCKKYESSLNHPFWAQCQKALSQYPL